ncbi:MAG: LamG domain-containing protein [Kofleriaceae bacterium]|nr:LamG domain-containing protein [Kofleriaceae bacterium]
MRSLLLVRSLLPAVLFPAVACGRVGFGGDAQDAHDAHDAHDAAPPTYVDAVLAHGPYAYYRLGDPQGTVARDSGGAQRDAVIISIDGTVVHGRAGALTADGDAALQLSALGNFGDGDAAYVRMSDVWPMWASDFTLEAFVRPLAPPPANWRHSLWVCENYANNGLRTGWNDNWFPMVWTDESGAAGQYVGAIAITPDAWNHLAIVRRADTIEIYANGVAAGAFAFDYVPPDPTARCAFGALNGMPSSADIDEAALYDRALQADELASHVTAWR